MALEKVGVPNRIGFGGIGRYSNMNVVFLPVNIGETIGNLNSYCLARHKGNGGVGNRLANGSVGIRSCASVFPYDLRGIIAGANARDELELRRNRLRTCAVGATLYLLVAAFSIGW